MIPLCPLSRSGSPWDSAPANAESWAHAGFDGSMEVALLVTMSIVLSVTSGDSKDASVFTRPLSSPPHPMIGMRGTEGKWEAHIAA